MDKYNAMFVSEWDGGFKVVSRCKVDDKTRMILEIGPNNIGDNEEMLNAKDREYVVINGDSKEYEAVNLHETIEIENDKFYYK